MTVETYLGDCIETMRFWLPDQSIQTCVTSPPYFGLRDYGHEGQIGLEATPDAYVAKMVEVFREVRRVLRDDGTLWLNLGDSYNAAGRDGHGTRQGYKQSSNRASASKADNCRPSVDWLKPKDLIGIPWRVAFALQADGWYLRQDIIWHKPNPMPESVRDRCTKAHEYIFLLSKSERYFFDGKAIREGDQIYTRKASPKKIASSGALPNGPGTHGGFGKDITTVGANKRSVWTVATRPYKGAHFATYPPDLIEPCILAGSRPGDTVLDPFGGSGTTAAVAKKHGRHAVLCELNPEYIPLIEQRIAA